MSGSTEPSATSMADPAPITTPTAHPSRREMNKSKNHKADIEFAADIGQGLLLEVRRLQELLQEKKERIKELELDKAESERVIETLNVQFRAKELDNAESVEMLNRQLRAKELDKAESERVTEMLNRQLQAKEESEGI